MRFQPWKHATALCLALTALAAGIALGACGGGTEEETASAPAAQEAPAAPAAPPATPAPAAPSGNVQVDPQLAAYPRVSGVSGTLTSVGSDTLNNLMTLWAEEFRRLYPSVRIQVEGKGSSTAPPALIENTAQLGPMSREMKDSEVDAFEKKFGYEPTRIRVAVDALAVYVHQDNPLEQLTIPQLDAIFSRSRACGSPREVGTWGDLGVTGSLAAQPFSLYGRNSASGTYGFFKDEALCKGDFKDIVKEQPGSASVVQGITRDLRGIGYSGIGYRTSGVKILKIAKAGGQQFHGVDPESVLAGEYPLSRFLYVYINQPPGRPLDPLVKQFLTFVLSREGQEVVVRDGYLPVTAAIAREELGKLQ